MQAFLRQQYPDCPTKADPAYFGWKFDQHPAGSALKDYLVVLDGDEVVGQMALMADEITVGERIHRCHWLTDLIIADSHRQSPLLWRLFDTVMQQHDLLLVSGTTERLKPLYARLGWRQVATAVSYYQILQPGGALQVGGGADGSRQRLRKWRPILTFADAVLPTIWRLTGAVLGRAPGRQVRIMSDASGVSALFDRLRPRLGTTTVRNEEVYAWKSALRPVGQSVVLAAYCDGTEDMVGSALLKVMSRSETITWVEIVDLLADPADAATVTALLTAARRVALEEGAAFLHLRCSWPVLEETLRSPLWIKRPVAFTNAVLVATADVALADELASSAWTLTALGGDTTDTGRDERPLPMPREGIRAVSA